MTTWMFDELPEAALREGLAYLAGPIREQGRREKIVLGAASPDHAGAYLS